MSDPSPGSGTHGDIGAVATSQSPDPHPTSTTTSSKVPSSYDVSASRRGVRSTRTPIGYGGTQGNEPHRSQTVPVPNTNLEAPVTSARRNVRAPVPSPTMPPPTTRQRTPSGGKRIPLGPDSNYIVEPLPSSSFLSHEQYRHKSEQEQQHSPSSYLAPPPPMPQAVTDARESMVSFQTEPSSYYTGEENWSTAGGPSMPMPEPNLGHGSYSQDSPDKPPPWLARPAPPMPTPMHENTAPLMPSAHAPSRPPGNWYLDDDEDNEGNQDSGYATIRRPRRIAEPQANVHSQQQDPGRPPPTPPGGRSSRMRYGEPVVADIPPPPTSPPPVPALFSDRPGSANRPDFSGGYGRPSGAAPPASPTSTAPLRIQHHPRPHGFVGTAPSVASTVPQSNNGRMPILQHAQPDDNAGTNGPAKPAGYNSSAPSAGRYEGRPTAPSTVTPSAPTYVPPKSSAPNNVPPKANTTYSQTNSHQDTSTVPGYGKTESAISPGPLKGRQETRPTAQTSAVKPTNATTQRPSATQSQASGMRPGASTAPIPPPSSLKPNTFSASQAQQHASTSGGHSKIENEKLAATSSPAVTASIPTRPHMRGAQSQMDTQYVNMLLALDDIPLLHNLCAGFFNWILLAGFILFPGTFTSLQTLSSTNGGQVPQHLIHAVTSLPLYIVAWVCCAIGGLGMIWLWWRWRKNYLWALNKIFVPGLLNSLAGLLSTIVNVFAVQNGDLLTTSKSTVIVTSACVGVFGILTLFYSLWLVRRVKSRHDRQVGKERAGQHGEGVVDLSKRRVRA